MKFGKLSIKYWEFRTITFLLETQRIHAYYLENSSSWNEFKYEYMYIILSTDVYQNNNTWLKSPSKQFKHLSPHLNLLSQSTNRFNRQLKKTLVLCHHVIILRYGGPLRIQNYTIHKYAKWGMYYMCRYTNAKGTITSRTAKLPEHTFTRWL